MRGIGAHADMAWQTSACFCLTHEGAETISSRQPRPSICVLWMWMFKLLCILAGCSGRADGLMGEIPTKVVDPLPPGIDKASTPKTQPSILAQV